MKTLYIHMGTHKTGTSVLQVMLARNAARLRKHGVHYPRRDNHTAAKAAAITSGNALDLADFMAGRLGHVKSLTPYKTDMKNAGDQNILYSSETFNTFSPDHVNAFTRLAKQFGYRIQCIFFVRSPAGYALSQYSQLIKRHGYLHEFERYLDKGFVLPVDNIKAAIELFGRDNVCVENYDAHRRNIQQFFLNTVLGFNADDFEIAPEEVNRSLTPFELQFMRACNNIKRDKSLSTYISDALIYGDTDTRYVPKISEENLKRVRRACSDDLKYINSLGVKPPVKMKDSTIKLGATQNFRLNPFQRATLSILLKLAEDQMKSALNP